jgi:hypothetical protein
MLLYDVDVVDASLVLNISSFLLMLLMPHAEDIQLCVDVVDANLVLNISSFMLMLLRF